MLPMPATKRWSMQQRLQLGLPGRQQVAESGPRHLVVDRVETEVGQLGHFLLELLGCGDEQLAEGPGIDETQLRAPRRTTAPRGCACRPGPWGWRAAAGRSCPDGRPGRRRCRASRAGTSPAGGCRPACGPRSGRRSPRRSLCRRTDRASVTSTFLIRLLTNSLSMSRRMVSTSGSSGMRLPPARSARRVSRPRRRAASPTPPGPPPARPASWSGPVPSPSGRPWTCTTAWNSLAWSGPSSRHGVDGKLVEGTGAQLLQTGLVVLAPRSGRRRLDAVARAGA